jgi:hypothetical protein
MVRPTAAVRGTKARCPDSRVFIYQTGFTSLARPPESRNHSSLWRLTDRSVRPVCAGRTLLSTGQ